MTGFGHQIRARGDKTIILVEHKMDLVMNVSDWISVMHQGKMLAEGTPSEISSDETVQAAYLGDLYGDFVGDTNRTVENRGEEINNQMGK